MEKYLLAKCKIFLCKIIQAIFPTGSKKDATLMHKDFLQMILDTAEIKKFLKGSAVEKISKWMAKPQLILAAIIWTKILW